jgi:hypothetical protein
MYKKITHHITEEHFGHPVATEIKKAIDKNQKQVKTTVVNVISESDFRSSVQDYFNNFLANLNKIIIAGPGPESGLVAAEESVFNTGNVDALGTMLKQYYGAEFGERINTSMHVFVMTIIALVRATRDNIDTKNLVTGRMQGMIASEVAQALFSVNNGLQYADTKQAVIDLANALILEIKAALKRDSSGVSSAQALASDTANRFVTYLVNGIVQQNPDYFTP